jgi:hypothetical protein
MSTSTTTPVIGYDLGSPSSPRAVSAWTTTDPQLLTHPGYPSSSIHDRRSSSPGRSKAVVSHYYPSSSSYPGTIEDAGVPPCFAIAYGTEHGSLHYRIYPSLDGSNGNPVDQQSSSQKYQGAAATSSSVSSRIISASWTGGMVSPLSSFNIDSNTQANFSGPVVSMVRCVNDTTFQPKGHQQPSLPQLFLVLVDDHKGSGPQQSQISSGAYSSAIITIKHGAFQKVATGMTMPRMSCAAYYPTTGFVYAAGTSILSLPPTVQAAIINTLSSGTSAYYHNPVVRYQAANVLPNPVRSSPSALSLVCEGRLAIVAVNNSFYAVSSLPQQHYQHHQQQQQQQQVKVSNSANVSSSCIKVLSLTQSSQVHPAIVTPISGTHTSSLIFVASGRECTTCIVSLVDGVIHASHGSSSNLNNFNNNNSTINANNNHEIISLTSPILSAVSLSSSHQTYVAILTTDGLVQLRLPVCIAVPLRTVEVGTRPNNFYWLGAFFSSSEYPSPDEEQQQCLISVGYSGDARVIVVKEDTPLDLSDRLMRLAIDAFGTNGFPRADLADALHASYSATSYIGPEPSQKAKLLLRQYLEAILGFLTTTTKPLVGEEQGRQQTSIGDHYQQQHINLILCSLLCLVSTSLTPPSASLASRAAKTATDAVSRSLHPIVSKPIKKIVQAISEVLLQHASSLTMQSSISLIRQSTAPITSSNSKNQGAESAVAFFESALWLLRAAGLHERAIQAVQDQMTSFGNSTGAAGVAAWSLNKYETYTASHLAELWSSRNLDFANLVLTTTATKHLLESNPALGLSVFTSSHPKSRQEWIEIEKGISRVTEKDPMYHLVDVHRVVALLKDTKIISPSVPLQNHEDEGKDEESIETRAAEISADDSGGGLEIQYKGGGVAPVVEIDSFSGKNEITFEDSYPLYSGRDLAICFLESAIGISSDRPLTADSTTSMIPVDTHVMERTVSLHEELAYFLLEGVLCERDGGHSETKKAHPQRNIVDAGDSSRFSRVAALDEDGDDCTTLGRIYRAKLRRLLAWPLFQGRAGQILASLPSSFLREKAMLLGKLNRHDDALKILYRDLHSLELALEYCDARHAQLMRERIALKRRGIYNKSVSNDAVEECVYLPLVRVALESSSSTTSSPSPGPQQSGEDHPSDAVNKRGVNAAIQVLSLRRHVIDRAAALRLLPSSIPVSAVSRPFLIPALVESESQVRRYKMASSLLRAR